MEHASNTKTTAPQTYLDTLNLEVLRKSPNGLKKITLADTANLKLDPDAIKLGYLLGFSDSATQRTNTNNIKEKLAIIEAANSRTLAA